LTGSTEVAEYLHSELSMMPQSTDEPDIIINIQSGFDPNLSYGLTGQTKVTDNKIVVDRRTDVPVHGIKDLIHNYVGTLGRQLQISCQEDCVKINIRYDSRVTSHNKMVRGAYKTIHRSYIYRSQNLAKVILYNDIEPIIHQYLLNSECAFIHASCVSRDGTGVLFSGWGGAGKTSVATNLIESGDWKFASDDLSLISSEGKIQPYLKRIQIYPYNIDPHREQQFLKEFSLRNRLNWRLRSGLLDQKSARRRILPNEQYPVSDHGHIDPAALVYLVREDRQDIVHERSDVDAIARRASATIIHEFGTHVRNLWPLTATHPEMWPSAEEYSNESNKIYKQFLDSAMCQLVRVPTDTNPRELTNYIQKEILSPIN